ncbi:MAG: MMPL family transporter [Solirubrobacterales bacterium]
MEKTRNIAARAGRWSARHRKTAIWGWLAFVVAAMLIGGSVGTKTLDNNQGGVGESGRAMKTVSDAFPDKASETVLVQSETLTAAEPAFRRVVAEVERRLVALRHVENFKSPYAPANRGQISRDGRSVLLTFDVPGNSDLAKKRVEAPLATVAEMQKANPDFVVAEFGEASADKELSQAFEDDFRKAEITSLPITLVILVVAFGALVAASVPLILALTAVAATIGLLGPVSHISAVDEAINSVVLLIGLAVGVDYSMFYLRREREERAAGNTESASLEAAAATSGRAVIISGFTVMIAMAGMYLAGASTFQSFATGTILVVAVAVVGSLTVLPAVLSWLGDRVEKGRVPFIGRLKKRAPTDGVWARVVDRVLQRPVISALAAAGVLVVLALPALNLKTSVSGVETLPQNLGVIKTYNRITEAFPGGPIPAEVVVSAEDVTAPPVAEALGKLRAEAAASPLYEQPITTDVSPDRTVAVVDIPVVGNGTDGDSNRALENLRNDLVPATVGSLPGVTADVGGYTAQSKDFNETMQSHVPFVFAFVLGAAFLLLLVTFRSIVIPLKAIFLNLLSVAAAYGVLVWIFQEGHLESALGFKSNGTITSWLPLFLFVVLFGLSMDYHVFILTRIREGFDRGRKTGDAVAYGIKTTAGVVTSAAVVMVSVFAIFATLSLLEFKEMGIGLAVAILIDATIIRAVLLPATMKLLGDWNWYLPSWLEWLPRVTPQGLDGLPPEMRRPASEPPASGGRGPEPGERRPEPVEA